MYRETSADILIEVEPQFVSERSDPEQSYYFFAYKVRIKNMGQAPAQLLGRHWVITDGQGRVHEVNGPGVVGEQPRLEPGSEYEYTSFCPLPTPTGNMRGSYDMVDDSGQRFDVSIPLFFLRTDLTTLH